MAGQYRGLAKIMLANGVSYAIMQTPVGPRCVSAKMAANRMTGGTAVASLRFACDGYCGLIPKHASKTCKSVDQTATSTIARGTPLPAGITAAGPTALPPPSGGGGFLQLPFGGG